MMCLLYGYIISLGTNTIVLTLLSLWVDTGHSTIGNDDRRTRTGYRNKMKREAFELMQHMAANLNIHDHVVARAKEE